NKKPYELQSGKLEGTLLGVFAANSVGTLTHPATSTHSHLVYKDKETGNKITAHIEQISVVSGAIINIPFAGP
ncbi:hypothetical protein, partial [Vibrio parahaemolyticus]|uniref:hypothetical protein n=1 Tax=Vibrio parahaemolyticus TaxID=670 RepID=UPI0021132F44